MNLLEQAIAAHGGIERWRALKRIELTLRCGGIAMALKGRPGILREPRATVDPRRPHGQFDRFGTFDAAPAFRRLSGRAAHTLAEADSAEVFGPWARAANHSCCMNASTACSSTRRRVVPRGLASPALVTIAIDDIKLD